LDLETSYTAPAVAAGATVTSTSYNGDGQVQSVARPGGDAVTPTYEASTGRLQSLAWSAGAATVSYQSSTGHIDTVAAPGTGGTLQYLYKGALVSDVKYTAAHLASTATVHRDYDAWLNLGAESVQGLPGGTTVAFAYDNDGLLLTAGALSIQREQSTGLPIGANLGVVNEARIWSALPRRRASR